MEWETLRDWLLSVGEMYGVDPMIFGLLYFGTLPFVAVSLVWLVRNRRRHRGVGLPLLIATACSLPAHVYVVVQARNVPLWGYLLVAVLFGFAFWRIFLNGPRISKA